MPTVYSTAPPADADEIATTLVDDQLAACVTQLSATSTYRWDGDIHHDEEVVLLAKTTDEAYDDLVDRLEAIHPYDVPCIERFDETHVLESFAQWREESVE